MIGHTDRATINKRRPMSAPMLQLLRVMVRDGRISGHRFDQADKSRARALMDRGYAMPDPSGWWSATPEGVEAAK